VAWHDRNLADAVRGVLVNEQGQVGPEQTLVPSNNFLSQARAAFAVDRYLVVFRSQSSQIRGQLLDSTLQSIGQSFTLSSSGFLPEVASNGSGFFVAWSNWRGTPIALNGAQAIPGGADFTGTLGSSGSFSNSVAWTGSNWSVLFNDFDQVHVSHLDTLGTLLAGSPQPVSNSPQSVRGCALSSGQGAGTALWTDSRNGEPAFTFEVEDIYGRLVLPPDSVGSARPISVSVPTQTRCRIAGDAQGGHLVAFISETSGQTRVLAQRVDASGNLVGPGAFEVASAPDRSIKRLDVGWNGSEWLVAWDRESRVSSPTVFARRFAGNGSALDPQPSRSSRGAGPRSTPWMACSSSRAS
jgi:hypothetical protein